MIATSFATMFVIFAVAAGLVSTFVLSVHKILRHAK
jgi:hypothetical protein